MHHRILPVIRNFNETISHAHVQPMKPSRKTSATSWMPMHIKYQRTLHNVFNIASLSTFSSFSSSIFDGGNESSFIFRSICTIVSGGSKKVYNTKNKPLLRSSSKLSPTIGNHLQLCFRYDSGVLFLVGPCRFRRFSG